MAKAYRRVDREQQFLLPVDMREWLPADHLAWFVLAVVEELDTSAFHRRGRLGGAGRAGFDPDMLLALLIYAYCRGVRSSRQVERLCEVDVAFRVICAQDVPDHTVIARFRAAHDEEFAALFTQVLVLAARQGLARFGTIAIDGTKIEANAALGANRSEDWLREQVSTILAEAEQVDAAEDAQHGPGSRGDELPAELVEPTSRAQRIRAALAQVEAERADKQEQDDKAQQRIEALQDGQRPKGRDPVGQDGVRAAQSRLDQLTALQQGKVEAYEAAVAAGRRPTGRPPSLVAHCAHIQQAKAAVAHAAAQAAERLQAAQARPRRANITDPDSRVMPTRKGWVQGYNVQVAVTGDQLILATSVGQNPADCPTFVPMLTKALTAVQVCGKAGSGIETTVGTVLADAGYASTANLTAPGPDRLIALGKSRDQAKDARDRPTQADPPAGSTPLAAMEHRLRTPEGAALYKRRGATVEPAIGNLKKLIDRCSRRGLNAAAGEIHLAAASFNLLKMFRAQDLALA